MRPDLVLAVVLQWSCLPALAQQQEPPPPASDRVRIECRLVLSDLVRALDESKEATPDKLHAETLRRLRLRLPDAVIEPQRDLGFAIELAPGKRSLATVRARIERRNGLELRIVADDEYVSGQVRFDLAEEKRRLAKWLDAGGRAALAADPAAIRRYNEHAKDGPLAFSHLAWYVRAIRPSAEKPGRWGGSPFAKDSRLGPSSVSLFADEDWNGGTVPRHVLAKPAREHELLELVALNLHEQGFTGADLDPAGIGVIEDETRGAAIAYRIRPGRSRDYASWTEQHIGKCCAIVVDGRVVSAPYFMGRIPGNGVIRGDFSKDEAEQLAAVLTADSLPVAVEVRSIRGAPSAK